MISYPINKGVGKQVEFRGLTAQYLIIFAVGLLGSFVLLIVLFIAGISQWICITAGIFSASGVVFITFSLNRKYGPYGLMKMVTARRRPRRIVHRKSIRRIFKTNSTSY